MERPLRSSPAINPCFRAVTNMSLIMTPTLHLKTSRDGDSTTSPGSLFQCCITLSDETFSLFFFYFSILFDFTYRNIATLGWPMNKQFCHTMSFLHVVPFFFSSSNPGISLVSFYSSQTIPLRNCNYLRTWRLMKNIRKDIAVVKFKIAPVPLFNKWYIKYHYSLIWRNCKN